MSEHSEPLQDSPPTCLSVIICNEVIEDKRTNNKTLVSLFNGIVINTLPATHPRMFIMASLTDGRGKWPVSFIIRDPEGNKILHFDGEAVFQDPLSVLDISVEVQGLALPSVGVYFVDLMTGAYPLGHRRFTVYMNQPPTPPPPASL
ncbi:MAG TPA: hypothetical protein VGK19_20935 [Capsulimonadaceae bacterium]|jgi:hypothetical protein